MTLDPLLLSRIQFGFVVSFHIIFPSFTIGLSSWLVVLEALWLKSGKEGYLRLYRFWLKIFAITFGLGVFSGIHELPVRHQLERLFHRHRQHSGAAAQL